METDDLGDVTTTTWQYDALNRLISETSQSTNDDRDYADTFTYDLSSNRLSQTHTTLSDVVTTVFFYDANDRLLAEAKDAANDNTQDQYTEYAYNNTNQTGKTVFAGADNTGNIISSVTYTYDESGRMVMVQTDSDGDGNINSSVTYTYDTSNHCVTETIDDGTTVSTHSFLFDPENVTGYGKQIEEHIDGQLSKTFFIGHMIIAQHDATNGLLNFIQDGHCNTRALINTAAAIVQRFSFDAYGKTLTAENYTHADDALTMWLNPDGAYSIATGLTNHIERWRDGARFMSLDSYSGNNSDPISLHKYLYANGNPVVGVDPSGMFSLFGTLVSTKYIAANYLRQIKSAQRKVNLITYGLIGAHGVVWNSFSLAKTIFNEGPYVSDPSGFFISVSLTAGLSILAGHARSVFAQSGPIISTGIDFAMFDSDPNNVYIFGVEGSGLGASGFSFVGEIGPIWDADNYSDYAGTTTEVSASAFRLITSYGALGLQGIGLGGGISVSLGLSWNMNFTQTFGIGVGIGSYGLGMSFLGKKIDYLMKVPLARMPKWIKNSFTFMGRYMDKSALDLYDSLHEGGLNSAPGLLDKKS